jgi:hypothetical protein
MIRQPSSASVSLKWWTDKLRGECPPIHDGLPECGFFKTHNAKGGPWVAVEIRIERETDDSGELVVPEQLVALIGGEKRKPGPIWTHLRAISRDEFRALSAVAASPNFNPNKPINLMKKAVGPFG